jgi:hypothetical protein
MRWFKAFEADGGVAISDRMHQANPFHLEVNDERSLAGVLRKLSPHKSSFVA